MIETQIPGYEIISVIAKGAMAIVCRAVQTSLGRPVALKLLPPQNASDPDFVLRFQREASTAATLEHPNIVSIYDFGQAGDTYYIAMQLVEGQTLDALLRTGPLPAARVLEILGQVGAALDYAHRNGVIHRDIKPANIAVRKDGTAMVMDFGLARAVQSPVVTASSAVVGTPAYISPEQCTGGAVDHRADLYSLGVVLFEMLAGRRPFLGDGIVELCYRHASEEPPLLSSIRPDLAGPVEQVVSRALQKDPEARFQSAAELCAACEEAFRSDGTGSGVSETTPDSLTSIAGIRVPRLSRRRALAAGAVLLGLLALAPLAPTLLRGREAEPLPAPAPPPPPPDPDREKQSLRDRTDQVVRAMYAYGDRRRRLGPAARQRELSGLGLELRELHSLIAAYEQEHGPDHPLRSELYFARGLHFWYSGRAAKAREEWRNALLLESRNTDAREWLKQTEGGVLPP